MGTSMEISWWKELSIGNSWNSSLSTIDRASVGRFVKKVPFLETCDAALRRTTKVNNGAPGLWSLAGANAGRSNTPLCTASVLRGSPESESLRRIDLGISDGERETESLRDGKGKLNRRRSNSQEGRSDGVRPLWV